MQEAHKVCSTQEVERWILRFTGHIIELFDSSLVDMKTQVSVRLGFSFTQEIPEVFNRLRDDLPGNIGEHFYQVQLCPNLASGCVWVCAHKVKQLVHRDSFNGRRATRSKLPQEG